MITYADYVARKLQDAEDFEKLANKTMDTLWTPFTGHKVSRFATIEKWRDLLLIAQLAQTSAATEEEKTKWWMLECQLALDLKCFQA